MSNSKKKDFMKYKLLLILAVFAVLIYSCEDMYENQDKYAGEIVYPAKFDTIIGHIGYERVEIDLMKAGRIPSSEISMGKAIKTVVSYGDKEVVIDSVASYVNITELTEAKLYRFSISTEDEFGNKSIPQEIALLPFTSSDLANLEVPSPNIMKSPSAAIINWPKGLSSVIMDYKSMEYEYTDKDGNAKTGERDENPRFYIGNLETGQNVTVNMKYNVVPIVNKDTLLDTVQINSELNITMPAGSTEYSPSEKAVLEANGITIFTSDGAAGITKLVYPVTTNSLSDMFYFPDVKEVDLTGGDLFSVTTLKYDNRGYVDIVGGGEFVPFLRNVNNISENNAKALMDKLESGIVTKVKYIPHSMGLDDLLAPYVESGVVQLLDMPDSVLIPDQYMVNSSVQDGNWDVDVTFPATDAPDGDGLENIYKIELKAKSSSFAIAIPTEYKFNMEEYKYLKLKVYAPAKENFIGYYAYFQRIWPRFMNNMWAFGGNSVYGQEYTAPDAYTIPDSDLEKWTELKIDMSSYANRHTRVIILNIGKEPGGTFAPDSPIIYYFANMQFCKE